MNTFPEFKIKTRVYYEDTDAGGVVYYVNYLKFMERARTELLRAKGFDQVNLARENILFVVHSAQVKYLSPARLDDELWITAQITKIGKATLLFNQQVMLGTTDQVLCEGQIKIACVAADTFKPCALPTQLLMSKSVSVKGEHTCQ
jgi:4-hydroxybenzoyl-CoA thioesterase